MGLAVVIDDFLDDFEAVRGHLVRAKYEGVTNPADGVFYPDITVDIPDEVWAEIVYKLSKITESGIVVRQMFARLSKKGTEAPHQAHHDGLMGSFTALLYISKHCEGGTELVRHKETGYQCGSDPKDVAVWEKDHSKPEKWETIEMVDMKPNRLMLIDSNQMHRAQPLGGFGDNSENGRLVLTCFFDAVAK